MKTCTQSARHVRRSFTLIELLVVVAIIAILASMLLPALAKARNVALSAECQTRLKQLGMGFQFYTEEHDGIFPVEQYKNAAGSWVHWTVVMRPYMGESFMAHRDRFADDNMGYCPAYDQEAHVRPGGTVQIPAEGGNWPARMQTWRYQSYQINNWLGNQRMWSGNWVGVPAIRLDAVKKPSTTMMAGEGWRSSDFSDWDEPYYNPRHVNRFNYVRVDNSVASMADAQRDGPGVLWSASNGASEATVHFWASYFAPTYGGPF